MKNRSQRYDMNKTRPRHGKKHTQYKMCYIDGYIYEAISKQHLRLNS